VTGSKVQAIHARECEFEVVHSAAWRRVVERVYSNAEVIAKLRRLADAIEQDRPFRIQIAGERFWVPERAQFSIEHERGEDKEEIGFQLKLRIASRPADGSTADTPAGV